MIYNIVIMYVLQKYNTSSNTNTNINKNTNTIASHGLTIATNKCKCDACTLFEIVSLRFKW